MPIKIEKHSGGLTHTSPFVGRMDHPLTVNVDISELTTNEVDVNGFLKPGVPFKEDGTLCDGTGGEFVYGVVVAPTRIVGKNPTNESLGADTGRQLVTVGTIGVVNRDIVEDTLGRALTANEIAAFKAAGSLLRLTRT